MVTKPRHVQFATGIEKFKVSLVKPAVVLENSFAGCAEALVKFWSSNKTTSHEQSAG